jgi:hypothetical protein
MGLGPFDHRRRCLHSGAVVVMITHHDSLMFAKTLAKARINDREVDGAMQFKTVAIAMANALEEHCPEFSRDSFFNTMMGVAARKE